MSTKEKLVGGDADGLKDEWFTPKALRKGMAEEKEHTKDPAIKKEIAKDHLTQDPKYYDKLEKIEKPARMKYAQLLKQAMPIPHGTSWSPRTNSLSLAKPVGVRQTPGSLQLKPGESVGASAPAAPSVETPVAPPPMPVTNAPPPPITDTPITAGFTSTPPPKAAAAQPPVTAATPPPLPMPPPAQPMPVPAAAPVAPRVPVSPPEHPQAQHPSSTVRSASMKNATILERSALLMCAMKKA
jgi:hypothetical protein